MSKVKNLILVQEEIAPVKEFYRSIYKHLKNIYKYYSSIKPKNGIWAITEGPFISLIEEL